MKLKYDGVDYSTEKKDCIETEFGIIKDVKLISETNMLFAKILIALKGLIKNA